MIPQIIKIAYIGQAIFLLVAGVLSFFTGDEVAWMIGAIGIMYAVCNVLLFIIIPSM